MGSLILGATCSFPKWCTFYFIFESALLAGAEATTDAGPTDLREGSECGLSPFLPSPDERQLCLVHSKHLNSFGTSQRNAAMTQPCRKPCTAGEPRAPLGVSLFLWIHRKWDITSTRKQNKGRTQVHRTLPGGYPDCLMASVFPHSASAHAGWYSLRWCWDTVQTKQG